MRPLVPDGLNWPLGLAVGADGALFVADGGFTYALDAGGTLQSLGMLFTSGFPAPALARACARSTPDACSHRYHRPLPGGKHVLRP